MARPINVTQSFLPPLEEVTELLRGVWDRVYLTNNGPLVQRLEKELAERNGMERMVSAVNGTAAIEMAVQALGISGGEVVTTPFTFPATSTALVRMGCKPVFTEIDPETWNIDPDAVESAIGSQTAAILGVHVFGVPCDVRRLEEIGMKYHIPVIYDAAHANFVRVGGKSVFAWGDLSTVSFHATKLFHTVEGGALFSPHEPLLRKLESIRLFGYDETGNIADAGTNGKMNEVCAAVGIANMKYTDYVILKRKQLTELYLEHLWDIDGLTFQKVEAEQYNYAYFPVLFPTEKTALRVKERLNTEQIFPRRYFWPLLTDLTLFAESRRAGGLETAKSVSDRILCLPLYPDLEEADLITICRILKEAV